MAIDGIMIYYTSTKLGQKFVAMVTTTNKYNILSTVGMSNIKVHTHTLVTHSEALSTTPNNLF